MTRLSIRTAAVVALLGVVAVSGIATGSASASNTTGFTCRATGLGGVGFSDSHCVTAVGSGATFVHEALPENTSLPIAITNEGTPAATIKATVPKVGIPIAISCTTAAGKGIFNTQGAVPPKEMYSWGSAEIKFSGCTVEMPTGSGCTVTSGTVNTKPLLFTTYEQGMGVKFGPETGTTLAAVEISGCTGVASAFNGTWPLSGSVVLTPHGTTLASTHAESTAQGTLTFIGGNVAGLTSNITFKSTGGSGSGSGFGFTT